MVVAQCGQHTNLLCLHSDTEGQCEVMQDLVDLILEVRRQRVCVCVSMSECVCADL